MTTIMSEHVAAPPDPPAVARLLAEVGQLSDEDARRRLLADEPPRA